MAGVHRHRVLRPSDTQQGIRIRRLSSATSGLPQGVLLAVCPYRFARWAFPRKGETMITAEMVLEATGQAVALCPNYGVDHCATEIR